MTNQADDDWDQNEQQSSTSSSKSKHNPTLSQPTLSQPTLSQQTLSRKHSYTILNHVLLLDQQQKLISHTSEVLFVSNSEASCLLRHYGWKGKELQQEWFDNSSKVRKKVGLTIPDVNLSDKSLMRQKDGTITVQCQSAYCDEVPVADAFALACGHYFCNDCWTAFLTSQIEHGQACVFAKCMGMACQNNNNSHTHKFGCSCNEVVDESLFKRFVTDPKLLAKYQQWLLNQFVEGQHGIKWCNHPGCESAVQYVSGGMKSIQCNCGYLFCFSCSNVAHNPAPCDLVARWLLREKSDDATEIWLAAKTKECPKCLVRIEKNKACNHMTCLKCGFNFCWLCKGAWADHGSMSGGSYVCNKYEKEVAKGKISDEEKNITTNTRALQKYTYYYKRFKLSQDSIVITKKLLTTIEAAFAGDDLNKYGFIIEALEKLIAARRILQWTYPLSYHMKNSSTKHLFEYQQGILLNATEMLQDIMDSNSEAVDKLLSLRKEIVNKTASIEKFRCEMVQRVERGDFESELLNIVDLSMEKWGCSTCTTENNIDAKQCVKCASCKLHGEAECKACKIKVPQHI